MRFPLRPRAARVVFWSLSLVAFVAGGVVGWYVHASAGVVLWVLSAVFALVPFVFASNRHAGRWADWSAWGRSGNGPS